MNEQEIKLDGKYRYKGGGVARVLCVDRPGLYPVISMGDLGVICHHHKTGESGGDDRGLDLVKNKEGNKMNTEIKAGQRWMRNERPPEEARIEHVTEKYVFYVFSERGHEVFANGDDKEEFLEKYKLKPEPKTRPVTKDDIVKMLAENPVLFFSHPIGLLNWFQLGSPQQFFRSNSPSTFCYSHNPFAANPVIVGPEIEVVE